MENKIAFVTGGSRGLGKDMALAIANKGIDVVLTYKTNQAEAEKTVEEIKKKGQKAASLFLDMSDIKSLDTFIAQLKTTLQSTWGKDTFDYLIIIISMGMFIFVIIHPITIIPNFMFVIN